ncbi:MAG: protoporphyrinogen oxidase-like protein [Desulfobacteraceae bacterium]|nr:protoporphyrinogen oxidase-like protein [Desulfobacteraceae bacterium]MBC2718444.1 protoporphyrinogen oxidase-like protein [Desulfobacteraceae bacterium]
MTGLAAGYSSQAVIYEAAETPGGICSSYYVRPDETERLYTMPSDGEVYRFEIGGGHWIFGRDCAVLHFIRRLTPLRSYHRRSAVYFPRRDLYVPYPIQNHLSHLDTEIAVRALTEMTSTSTTSYGTMAEWLQVNFGWTLCEIFFHPFHELYTSGLWKQIAPQDSYKSPVNPILAIRGALDNAPPVGYNMTFVYPADDLSTFARRMASYVNVHYGKRVVQVDIKRKEVKFADGKTARYEHLISTLPLNKMMEITGLHVDAEIDPYTSVLVINIGAIKGPRCPEDHWLYIPESKAGFHRVGFYSNVDASFLPASMRKKNDQVSIYVEKAYPGGHKPAEDEIQLVCRQVIKELQEWGFIDRVEVVDPTWVDVAYTWSWPGSRWRQEALSVSEEHDIYQVGRYGRWLFQGIADSIRDGFVVGSAFKGM